MRPIFLHLFSLMLLSSCSVDIVVPCDEFGGPFENLCREYPYTNDVALGYIEYEYKGDSAIVASFFNPQTILQKTRTEKFKNGRVTIVAEQYPNAPSRIESWHYNEMDSISRIVYGANDSLLELTFENGKRKGEYYYSNSTLKRFLIYRYYQDDGKLYRVFNYNHLNQLLYYRHFEYFSTGQVQVSFYTSNHTFIGRKLYNSSPLGFTTSMQFTDSTGTIIQGATYTYDSSNKLIESNEFSSDETHKSLFLYY